MRYCFSLILFLFQFGVYAQVSPDSLMAYAAAPDTTSQPTSFIPAIRNLVRAELRESNYRELKIIGRSALVISGVSTAGVMTYKFGDEPLRNFTQANRTDFTANLSKLMEPLGRSKYLIWASAGFYGTGLVLRDAKLQRTGILVASSLMLNDMVTGQLKDEFQRRRPDITEQNHYFEGGEGGRYHASFPSGHTSTAFAFATSVATVYKDSRWVPPVAYGMATLVGLSRIHDNKHWATDVMAGATVGFLNAKVTHFLMKQAERQLEKRKINIYFSPSVSSQSIGLNFGGSF